MIINNICLYFENGGIFYSCSSLKNAEYGRVRLSLTSNSVVFVKTYFSLSTDFLSLPKSRCLTHLSTSTLFLKNVLEVILSYKRYKPYYSYKYCRVFFWAVEQAHKNPRGKAHESALSMACVLDSHERTEKWSW